MKTSFFIWISVTLLSVNISYSQARIIYEFGKPSEEDFAMEYYEKDPSAPVVILHDQGIFEYKIIRNQLTLVKTVYKKIKVFDSKGFDRNIENIPLASSNEGSREVTRIRGFIHRDPIQKSISKEDLLPSYIDGVGNVMRLLIRPIEDGDIIEYSYTIVSPFLFDLDGWNFQDEVPKLYSELIFKKPVGINFNDVLYGKEELYLNLANWRKDCLQITSGFTFRCPIYLYAMKDVPAFHMEEFMLSPKNYLARIEFEPKSVFVNKNFKNMHHFSSEWKDVDKILKKNWVFGKQLGKKSYFKRKIPDSILSIQEDVTRAKAVYGFIQDHFKWNGILYNYGTKIKEVFEDKIGNAAEINISLVNSLQAAKLDAKLMMVSTRENGLPTALHPVITKFNYAIVYLEIDGQVFLLDATDKKTPFGVLPYYTLNVQGRVLDFKRGSFWAPITPYRHNSLFVESSVKALSDGNFKGNINYTSSGYIAFEKRKIIEEIGVNNYAQDRGFTLDQRDIRDFQINDVENIDKPIKEKHSITFKLEEKDERYLLYPFYHHLYFEENPFKMDDRSFPIDFGFPFSNIYMVNIDLGNIYSAEKLPENRILRLPGKDGLCSITYSLEDSKIKVHFNFSLNEYRFQPEAYNLLREFFQYAVDALKEDAIILKKNIP